MLKQIITFWFLISSVSLFSQVFGIDTRWGDQGNGKYVNPVLNADYSDPDVIRVGEKYYMVCSDFHFIGMPVLESEDMVNWKIISQLYDRFDFPEWEKNERYGGGSWAPAIRFHDNKFWVFFCTPHEGLFMSTATDPSGPWAPLCHVKNVSGWEDPCPFWDGDGQAYLGRSQLGAGPIYIHKMSPDGTRLLDDGVIVYEGPVAEGTKIHKWNGYYYMSIPEGGVSTGWQTILRSKNIYGPYERKIVLEQGNTDVNGPHQGSLVDTPEGEWWFYHFQSTDPLGRVVHLQPVTWKDGWPFIGVDRDGNGIGEPVKDRTKPHTGKTIQPFAPQTSDEFSSSKLSLQWQINHNPVKSAYSLTERSGYLTLHALKAENLRQSRNMFTQKVMGYEGKAVTELDCSKMADGQRAGLFCIGGRFNAIGVLRENGKKYIYTESDGNIEKRESFNGKVVYFNVSLDAINNRHQLYYSFDNVEFIPCGEAFNLWSSDWKGNRVGVFSYNTINKKGKAFFNWFRYTHDGPGEKKTNQSLQSNKWEISYDSEKNGINIKKNSRLIFEDLYASYHLGDKEISTKDYSEKNYQTKAIRDNFGSGTAFIVTYTQSNLPELIQTFYSYSDKDYILTEFVLESKEEVSSNYMAPVNLKNLNITGNEDNRALFIPFDNDCWIRYQSHPLNFDKLISYEVTSVFDNKTRNGMVIGSVEHDNWKTAVEMESQNSNAISSIVCYGGVADSLTRDSKPHGMLSGKIIKSPKAFIGFFDDWRDGLDNYGEANAIIAPPKAWNKAIPFGWNSWGVLQFKLRFHHAMEISDYFNNHLQNNHFVNQDGVLYIGLDSGWNRFSEEQLTEFVRKCKENGQIAGIYWTPFTDWGKNPEATVQDSEEYKFKDIYVYANGNPQELDGAYAIDPTHPAIEDRMKKTSDLFRRCGFEYVKMDFMTHGAMEGDRWYNPEIQTGIQAYNYGMKLLNRYFGDMYINISISPTFPAQYAQSRRIACDAWNKIKDTEYTMNAVSYGWWIDKVYQYNDADHIVLQEATEGENRARITSAVITGLYIAGDDFSEKGSEEGKERAANYLTNPAINALATGVTFRPLEGNGSRSENQFMRSEKNGIHYVFFNYEEDSVDMTIPTERIGLTSGKKYKVSNLWSGEEVDLNATHTIPGKDVLVVFISI